jgi:hypothetical protein
MKELANLVKSEGTLGEAHQIVAIAPMDILLLSKRQGRAQGAKEGNISSV